MKILFVMLNTGYVRNYNPALRELAARGHQIHIAYQVSRNKMGENVTMDDLVRDFPGVTAGPAMEPEDGFWRVLARTVRGLLDYTRYLDPSYESALALRRRMAIQLPTSFVRLVHAVSFLGQPIRRLFMRALLRIEWCVPRSASVSRFVGEHAPDIMLVTPLVEPFSSQVDYVKEAAYRGIPSGLCVASWDNLTNKGLVRIVPDRVFLWNESQGGEARDLHGVSADRIVVTGAQLFDQWFTWKSKRTREAFCARVGLDPQKPYVLYLGSSFFIAPNEAEFVDRWIHALRGLDSALSDYSVLVRPHPSNAQQFLGLDLSVFRAVSIWPGWDVNFFAQNSREDFFDSLYYSAAVVGVNTSALIEAAIVGRCVCTVLAPDFAHSQEGTLHFQLLAGGDSPLLRVANGFDEHFRHLEEAVTPTPEVRQRISGFVQNFVRPHGLDTPAAQVLADAIEHMGNIQVSARRISRLDGMLRVLVAAPTLLAGRVWRRMDKRVSAAFDFTTWLANNMAKGWVQYQIRCVQMMLRHPALAVGTAAGISPLAASALLAEQAATKPTTRTAENTGKAVAGNLGDAALHVQPVESKLSRRRAAAERRLADLRNREAKQRKLDDKLRAKEAERRRKEAKASRRRREKPLWARLPAPVRERVSRGKLTVHRLRKRVVSVGAVAGVRTRRAGDRTISRLRQWTARLRNR